MAGKCLASIFNAGGHVMLGARGRVTIAEQCTVKLFWINPKLSRKPLQTSYYQQVEPN